ncbi:MAG: toxin-antitoxin system YwqK family antitoxin [Bacteroidia bacterium]
MKKIFLLALLLLAGFAAKAQYTATEIGPNGNKLSEGQYTANPGLLPSDSKEDMARKMAAVHKIGTWKYWFDSGKMAAEEHYTSAGKQTGIWKTWYINGQVASVVDYTKNTAVYYHDNGQKSSEGSMNGVMQVGAWKGWHANGKMNFSGSFDASGQKHGTWTFWDENGAVMGTENWNHGAAKN